MTERLCIPGDPRGKGSSRGGRPGQRAHTDPITRAWMTRAVAVVRKQRAGPTIVGPVNVTITAIFARPDYLTPNFESRVSQPPVERISHVVKPDADNVSKAVLDVLTKAGVIGDDARVCVLTVRKWWGAVGEEPGIDVVVEEVGDAWAMWALLRGERPDA